MKRGFTLVELMVVIAVIVVLASISTISYHAIQKDSRDTARRAAAQEVKSAVDALKLRYDTRLQVGGYNTSPGDPTTEGLCPYNTTTTSVSHTTANWVYFGSAGTGTNYPCTLGHMLQRTGVLKPTFFDTIPPNDEYDVEEAKSYAGMVLYRCDVEGRRWMLYYHLRKPTSRETTEMTQLHGSCAATSPSLTELRDTLKMRAAMEIRL